jgi:hypothetical protein
MEQQYNAYENEKNAYDFWKVIVKRKRLVIGIFILFAVASVIMSFVMPKIYQGDAMLMVQPASNLTAKELIDIIGKIDNDTLKSILPKTHNSITDIKFNIVKDTKDANKVMVTIEGKNIDDIQPALLELIDYIKNIDIFKNNIREEQERLKNRSEELNTIIAASSGLLNSYDQMLKNGKLVPLGFNPIELNRKISDIKVENFQIVQLMQRVKGGVEIARQLHVKSHHVKPSKRSYMMTGGLAGLFIGIVLAFAREYQEKMANNNKE